MNWKALETDAVDYWDEWSKTLDSVQKAIPIAIKRDDFSHIPGTDAVFAAYQKAASALREYVGEGSDTFDRIAKMLLETALGYAEAEEQAAASVARLTSEMEAL